MDSKGYSYGTTLQPFKGLCQGNGEAPPGWFLIILIMIIYLKYKVHGFKIKNCNHRKGLQDSEHGVCRRRSYTDSGEEIINKVERGNATIPKNSG